MYNRSDLKTVIPDVTADTVGDGTYDERQSFAFNYNAVLAALRSEVYPEKISASCWLTDDEVSRAVAIAAESWGAFRGSNVVDYGARAAATIRWLRDKLTTPLRAAYLNALSCAGWGVDEGCLHRATPER